MAPSLDWDGQGHSRLRLRKMVDIGKICSEVNHHRGHGSIRYVGYLLSVNHKLVSITGGNVLLLRVFC